MTAHIAKLIGRAYRKPTKNLFALATFMPLGDGPVPGVRSMGRT